ncbi:MAG: efflux RND transporter periplasmic adaptor subunit [Muribaculaceae bacterium]|nr:efflux RND transporter periplasmic adaptor subunit [Muribaculaceae bacterium]
MLLTNSLKESLPLKYSSSTLRIAAVVSFRRGSILLALIFALISFTFSSCRNSENHEDEEHHIHTEGKLLSEEQIQEFGIEMETVAPQPFRDVLKVAGTIQPSTGDLQTITAKKSGIITFSPGISEGIEIKAGSVIGNILSDGLQGGDVNAAAISNLNVAKKEYERLKKLYDEGLVTASSLSQAEKNYKEAEALVGKKGTGPSSNVVAPISGNLINVSVKNGEFVEAGRPIASIVKNTRQSLKAELPVREAKHLGHIESANFLTEAGDLVKLDECFGQKVSSGTIPSSNGYIPVIFSFQGNQSTAIGGFVQVFLLCGQRENIISIPLQALIEIQGHTYVYVEDSEHGFEKKLVKTGASDGERIEITEGLSAGDKVVTKGASIVRMAEVSAVAPPSHSH